MYPSITCTCIYVKYDGLLNRKQMNITLPTEELYDMKNNQKREERIKVNIKGISPLHFLFCTIRGWYSQVPVTTKPIKSQTSLSI